MAEALKNAYNEAYIHRLVDAVSAVYPEFDQTSFTQGVFDDDWPNKELKQRMTHISDMLKHHIPLSYPKSVEILKQAAPEFGGFEAMFFPDFVQRFGLDDWETSMQALEYLTQFSSSEFAVRVYIEKDPERMMMQMKLWAEHDNEHVRRLASEGCRPRLPWAPQLPMFKKDPKPILPILKKLQTDESLYVRKSVSNNLNDISKDHPQLMITWGEAFLGEHKHSDWVIRKGLRTLMKKANPTVLQLFGYTDVVHIKVLNFKLDAKRIKIGDSLGFSFDLQSKEELGKVRIEFAIDYMKAYGRHNQKVFMLADKVFDSKNESLSGKQSFREMSTRKHYPGEHRIYIRVNGMYKASQTFVVES